jgi:hypothetical protein
MTWTDALQVGTVILAALGGGGAIVVGLSGFIGKIWVDRLKGDIDVKLRRLDAALEHHNFLLRRFAEFELEAITECWRAARACVPLLNSTRAIDSGTDEGILAVRKQELSDAHNALLSTIGRHEPFLPDDVAGKLEAIRRVVALELSNIHHHRHFEGDWWDKGEANQRALKELTDGLLTHVKARANELRADLDAKRSS